MTFLIKVDAIEPISNIEASSQTVLGISQCKHELTTVSLALNKDMAEKIPVPPTIPIVSQLSKDLCTEPVAEEIILVEVPFAENNIDNILNTVDVVGGSIQVFCSKGKLVKQSSYQHFSQVLLQRNSK